MDDYDFTTHEGCLAAVQECGCMLDYVSDEMKTYKICLAAVLNEGYALYYVPYEMKTPEICLAAVQEYGRALVYIPEHMRTTEICLAAVKKNGYALKFVPEYQQTNEIIQAAITQNPDAAQFIKKTITIHHGSPKQMPENAYDTLEMGYDVDSAIQDGELMVDFHNEFTYGRYYRKATFEKFVLPSKKNPLTSETITEYTIYKAIVVV